MTKMRNTLLAGAAVIAGAVAFGAPANALPVTMNANDGTNTLTVGPNDAGTNFVSNSPMGSVKVSGAATGSATLPPPQLSTNTIVAVNVGAQNTLTQVINVWAWETGLTTPTGLVTFQSGFTTNPLPGTASVVERTYYAADNSAPDTTNNTFAGGSLIHQISYPALNAAQSDTFFDDVNIGGTPYSVAVQYIITFTDAIDGNSFNGTIVLNQYVHPAPEPVSIALMGSAIAGLGFARMRRRR